MKSFPDFLLDTADTLKHGKKHLIAHVGRVIAVLTVILAVILTFAEVTIISDFTRRLTSEIIVLTVAAVLMYFAMQTEGELAGQQNEEYQKQKSAARTAAEGIRADRIDGLSEYVERYVRSELEARRRNLLYAYGYSEVQYTAYLTSHEGVARRARRIFRRVERMRPIRLSVNMLLGDTQRHEPTFTLPTTRRRLLTLGRLLPSLLGMLVTVSVIIEWHEPFTLSVLMEGAVKLCALLSVGLKGYLDGHEYVVGPLCSHLAQKSRLLNAFLLENQQSSA